MAPTTQTEDTDALLDRLTQKPGVQSSLVLSRKDGCIVRTSGLLASNHSPDTTSALSPSKKSGSADKSFAVNTVGASTLGAEASEYNSSHSEQVRDADEVARMVWSFVRAAGTMAETIDAEGEVKLLRLRTRKNELVIVPDSKFLLVVIHDTPPA